ncbi:sensor histidine kinase [Clostridium sp. B9]|uniref:sensor histidine kinase n=1 Tax=Clostridium sp. B9 TaxID=3423224 RepID=UPI003D2EB86F
MKYKVIDENPKLQYYLLRVVCIAIVIVGAFEIYEYNYNFYYKLLKVTSIILMGTAILIGESSRIINKKNLTSYICIAIFWIMIPEILFLIDDLNGAYSLKYFLSYKIFSILIQNISFTLAVDSKLKKEDFKVLKYKLLSTTILVNAIYVLLILNSELIDLVINILYENDFIFLYVLIMFLLNFIMLASKSENTSDKFFYYTALYLLLNSIGDFILLNNLDLNISSYSLELAFGLLLHFISYYILAEGIIRLSLNKSFNEINKSIHKKRNEYKKNKKYLNKKLKELKELEDILVKEERLFNKVISEIGDCLFMFNRNKLFYLNDKALEFIDIKRGESIFFEEIDEINKRINSKLIYAKANSNSKNNYSEIIFRNNNNEFLEGEIYTVEFSDIYKIIILKDVTNRNNALRLNSYLSKKLDEENVKGEFFTNICHELRTPINVINSALQLNDINIKSQNIKSVTRNNFIIRQNCLRLIRTINNFIDANRISEGHIEAMVTVYNIVEVVENILEASSSYIRKKNINFVFDPDFEEIFIAFDRDFLERIVLNILSNSVKYGKENGNIYVRIYFEERDLVILVENDGVSISYDEQKYIFDKFTKNNKSLNRTQEGSGLGLYISKSLMKMQGGDLKLNIYEGDGNQFKLYFYNVDLFKENSRDEHYMDNEIYNILEKAEIEFSDIYV